MFWIPSLCDDLPPGFAPGVFLCLESHLFGLT
nr:MAG TPA: hypothetical protein [Caudoviricetes sp.]